MAQANRDNNYVTTLLGTSSSDGTTPILIYADASTNRLLVDALSEIAGHGTLASVRRTVTTAGTAEQLASASCKRVVVQALADNTNAVVIGDSGVVAAEGTREGIALFPNQTMEFFVNNTNLLYVDAVTSGEGISYVYEN